MAFRIEGEFGKRPAAGVDHRTRNAAVADEEIRSPADNPDRDAPPAAVIDEKREGVERVRLDPILRRSADKERGVLAHRLVELSVDFSGWHERAHFLKDLEVGGDAGACFVDVSGTEGDEQVAGFQGVCDLVVGGCQIGEKGCRDIAMHLHRIDQRLARDPGDGRLGCRIDIGDENEIRRLKDFSEIIGQRLGAGVAVGLEEHHDTGRLQRTGRLQCRRKLGGVVAVVVDDAVGGREVFRFETALGTGEGGEGAGDEREFRAAAIGHRDGGK